MRKIHWSIAAATLIGVALLSTVAAAQTVTFVINNKCNQTIYPAIYPAVYQNGGWTMAPNTSVSFPVSSTFNGRLWSRKNCNTATSPYVCTTGSCGGTGAQCAGSTGVGTTSLEEFALAGSTTGTDWYDVSDVDAYDFPVSISMSSDVTSGYPGEGYEPTATADAITYCPAALQVFDTNHNLVSCQNPCNVYNTPQVCCTMQVPQDCRDSVAAWPLTAQQYVDDVHNTQGETYSYPWDDWWGLHTVQGGSTTWTLTWCPNNVQPGTTGSAGTWPAGVTGMAGSSTGTNATITWNAASGATSYSIFRSANDGANTGESIDPALASNLTGLSYTDTGLTSGTKYYYSVIAYNSAGLSPSSAQLVVVAGAGAGSTIPLLTTNITDTVSSTRIVLSWTAAPYATSYNIYRGSSSNGEPTTPYATTSSTSFTDTAVVANSTVFYMVAGVNSVGMGSPSNEIEATPSNTVYPPGDIPIDCGGSAITPYLADTDFSGGAANTVTNAVNVNNVTNPAPEAVYQSNRYGNFTYTVPGLSAGAACTVRLHFAETFHTAAGQRTFNVLINNTQVLTSYDIFAAAGGENIANIQQFNTTANSSGQVVIQFVSVIDNAQVNGIEVYQTNGGGAPPIPTGLVATPGNAQVSLTWGVSTGATTYNVYRATASGAEGTTPVATGITSPSYTSAGLTNGTTYFFKVAAVSSGGTSGQSAEASATPVGGGTEAPYLGTPWPIAGTVQAENYDTGGQGVGYNVTSVNGTGNAYRSDGVDLEATTDTGGGYDLGWTTAGQWTRYTVNVATAGSYTVSFRLASPTAVTDGLHLSNSSGTNLSGSVNVPATGGYQTWATVSATVTLPAGKQVLTVNQDAAGWNINYLAFALIGGSAPAAPTLSATAGNAQVVLSWTSSSGATTYNVYRGTTAGGESTTAIATGITATTYTNTGLTNGTTYYYKVAALNSFGTSPLSNEVTAPTGGVPPTPTGLTATPGNAQVALSWTASSGATTYNVYRGTATGGESATAIATGIVTTGYTNTGLTNGTKYFYTVKAVNAVGTTAASNEASATPTAGTSEAPYLGTPWPIAGTVQAENYDTGGQGVAYNMTSTNGTGNSYRSDGIDLEACTDTGGGYNVGWTTAGQWMRYTVNVATAGTYTVSFRVAAPTAVTDGFHLSNSSGTNLSGNVNVPATGAYQTWATVTATVTLPAGQQVLTLNQDAAGWNINWFAFASAGLTPVIQIDCGGAATGTWVADTDFAGGTAVTTTNTIDTTAVTNPAPVAVYQSNRYNAPTYTIGGLTANAAYTVRLHFAETYWTAAGKREFNISINGTQVLTNFDIFATAGAINKANIQQFTATANGSGQIVITSVNVVDNAQINGIEIEH